MHKKKGKNIVLSTTAAKEEDPRPEFSPYTKSFADIYFGEGKVAFKIPESLLLQYPKLSIERDSWHSDRRWKDIPEDVGHTLIHHLYTGSYQCLKPTGSSSDESKAVEFATSIRVYTAARAYDLSALATQAQSEITKLGENLSLGTIMKVVQNACPGSKTDDEWFYQYLKTRMKETLQSPAGIQQLGGVGNAISIVEILLHSAIEVINEKIMPAADGPQCRDVKDSEPHVLASNMSESPAGPTAKQVEEAELNAREAPEPEEVEHLTASNDNNQCAAVTQELGLGPESKPEKVEDEEFWGWSGPSKKDKKKKKKIIPEPEPEPEPMEVEVEDDESWSSWGTNKDKKKKNKNKNSTFGDPEPIPELEPEPESELKPEGVENDDVCASFGSAERKKANMPTMPEAGLTPTSGLKSARLEDGLFPKVLEDADPMTPKEVHPAQTERVAMATVDPQSFSFTAPVNEDDWSLCESSTQAGEPELKCSRAAEHVFGGSWKSCPDCESFVRRLSRGLEGE